MHAKKASVVIVSLYFALTVAQPLLTPDVEDPEEPRQLGGLPSAFPGAGAAGPFAGMLNAANPFFQATAPVSHAVESIAPLMDVFGPLQIAMQGVSPSSNSATGLAPALPLPL